MATKKKAPAKKAPAKKPAAKPVAKKVPAKKVAAKPAAKKAPAKKVAAKPVAKKAPAKKAAAKPVAKKAPAKKVVSKPVAKKAPVKNPVAKKLVEEPVKKERKAPPKMKKMVVKPVPIPVQEELYENESKDFAFAFAQSMMQEQKVAEAKKSQAIAASAVKLPKRPTSREKGAETLKFSDADLAQFRKSLIALRESIVGKTATLKTNALEQTIDRAGEDEDGSDSFMRLQNLGQVGEQNKTLQKIDEALHRIEDGTYGICEICGQLIRKPRLRHLPFAHTCMECQSAMESNPDAVVQG